MTGFHTNMKLKFTCNWTDDKSLYARILSNYAVKDEYYDIITFKNDYDFLIIINDIINKENLLNKKTIGVIMEPSWNHWNKDLHKFCDLVMFHDKTLYNHNNVVEWTNCGFMHDIISYQMFDDNLPSNMSSNNWIKPKEISFICGEKNQLKDGYRLRDNLSKYFLENTTNVDVYGRNFEQNFRKNIFGALKLKYNGLLNYKFSICIESCFEKGYISEKLYDCFMSNTVPIYCGAPNILNIFDSNSLITFNNELECLKIIEEIQSGKIQYENFNLKNAKNKYLTELNLINQILNIIKIYF